jgi:hypothetical protein
VTADSYADSAENVSNFWCYLGPGDPDPAAEEVNRIRADAGKPPIGP